MIRKLMITILLLGAVALAQMPHNGRGPGGPQDRMEGRGMEARGQMHPLLPPGRWWKNAEVVKAVGLSEAQVQKIEQIFQDNRMKLVDVHASLQKEEIKLEPLLDADNPEEAAVLGATDRIIDARASVEKANAHMAFAIRKVLTPEQWKKLHALGGHHDRFPLPMDGPMSYHNHGGPAAPGAPGVPPAPGAPEAAK